MMRIIRVLIMYTELELDSLYRLQLFNNKMVFAIVIV